MRATIACELRADAGMTTAAAAKIEPDIRPRARQYNPHIGGSLMRSCWCCPLLLLAVLAQGQTLCFSGRNPCPEAAGIWFIPLSAPSSLRLPRPAAILPAYRPVVPLELSPLSKQFLISGTANLSLPASPMMPFPAPLPSQGELPAGGMTLPAVGAGGVTVNTGFGH